jgi:hypothetical protein
VFLLFQQPFGNFKFHLGRGGSLRLPQPTREFLCFSAQAVEIIIGHFAPLQAKSRPLSLFQSIEKSRKRLAKTARKAKTAVAAIR